MRAVIFANGDLGSPEIARQAIQPGDLLIAADGGGKHCLALGLLPHLLVGDLDSLDAESVSHFESRGTEIMRFPQRKDFTDLELALFQARDRGAEDILILAALGQRWDQTMANLLLPAGQALADVRIRLLDGHQEIRLLRAGERLTITGQPGDTVSLIPLAGDACGVATEGLEYPLIDENLVFGATRGISNVLQEQSASVSLREGLLLIVMIHGTL